MSLQLDDNPVLLDHEPAADVLGDRRLVAVQCIDIGRLQSDVVPLPRAGLVGITGQGPIDSNGSSKTTFLAALDLLGMSYAWRPASGRTGSHARGLVLDIDGSRSEVGYVLGWWCPPGGTGGSVTTIARVERTGSTPLRFKVGAGCRLADGSSHQDRVDDAHAIWQELDGEAYSARRYLQVVLEGEPRSAGFVAKRGDLPAAVVSLFTTELERLDPVQIGQDLIQLTGLEQHVESERAGRRDLARDEHDLRVKQDNHQDLVDRAEANQADRQRRADALASAAAARLTRQGWTARRLADAVERVVDDADRRRAMLQAPATVDQQAAIAQLQDRVARLSDDETLARELARLAAREGALRVPAEAARQAVQDAQVTKGVADDHVRRADERRDAGVRSDRPVETVSRDLEEATEQLQGTRTEQALARTRVADARHRLDVVESDGIEAVRELRAHGVEAWSLVDDVEVHPDHQARFDAVLDRFADAVVVAPSDRDRAVRLLADRPGTLIVAGAAPDGPPPGVVTAPDAAAALLADLAHASAVGPADVSAFQVPQPEHVVVGGWSRPQVGRAARLAAARMAVDEAEASLAAADRRVAGLLQHQQGLQRELAANEAEAEHASATAALALAVVALRAARDEAVDPMRLHEAAVRERDQTQARVDTRREDLADAEKALAHAQQALRTTVLAPVSELLALSRRIPIVDLVAAVAAIDGEGGPDVDDLDRAEPDPADAEVLRATAARVLESVRERLETVAPGLAEDWRATESWRLGSIDALRAAGRHVGVGFRDDRGRRKFVASDQVPGVLVEAWQRRWDDMQHEDREAEPAADAVPGSTYLDSWVYDIADAMTSWLAGRVERDRADGAAERRRVDRSAAELSTAQDAVRATRTSYEAHRDTIVVSVEEQLKDVGAAFGARVGSIDGAAANLHMRRVDPHADGPLQWEVIPAWAPGPDQKPVDYRRARPSTAQSKLKTVQLVLAAFSGRAGRMLILDEVAAAYGREHFRIVLNGLHDAARREQLTVLATLQDSHLGPATALLAEAVFFRYRGGGQVLNDPTVAFLKGDAADGDVVTALRSLLNGHRDRSWVPLVDPERAWDGHSTLAPEDAGELFSEDGPAS